MILLSNMSTKVTDASCWCFACRLKKKDTDVKTIFWMVMVKYAQTCLNLGKFPQKSRLLFHEFKCFNKGINENKQKQWRLFVTFN